MAEKSDVLLLIVVIRKVIVRAQEKKRSGAHLRPLTHMVRSTVRASVVKINIIGFGAK
jgi:hypothetical protein